MQVFIDTANIEEIKKVYEMGIIRGVTTNPSLISKENKNIREIIQEISKIVDGPISAEVNALSPTSKEMVEEGIKLSKIHKNIVIKLPTTQEGLKACKELHDLGIQTNMTLIFNVPQALLAINAGASYISPFVGRLDDLAIDGLQLIKDLTEIIKQDRTNVKVIAASIRSKNHIVECAKAGVDIVTVPYKIIIQMIEHPLTQQGLKQFQSDTIKS